MKKLLIIICVLLIIFFGMYAYRRSQNQNMVTASDVSEIETYISQIYMWKEVTGEALPKFDNINNAPDLWVWEVVTKNLDKYELTYEEIQEKAVEIFGDKFEKQFPKEGTESIIYDAEQNKYYTSGMGLDTLEDMFYIKEIQKENNRYEIEIVEYLEDYADEIQDGTEDIIEEEVANEENQNTTEPEYNIYIKNLNEETIATIKSTEGETRTIEVVKENIDKFSSKKIILEKENNKLVVEEVE